MTRRFGIVLLALSFLVPAATASAATIEFTATDLGGDRWLYDYFLSAPFPEGQGFTVYFNYELYSELQLEAPAPGDPDWEAQVVQPEVGLLSDGFYDALALIPGASPAGPFQVSFRWLGAGAPGSQPFEIYVLDPFDIVEVGLTGPRAVPEPGALTLLLLGAGIGSARRMSSRVPRNR